jgi:hypothetical protein
MYLKEKIIEENEIISKMIEVPEWNITVVMIRMSSEDRLRILESFSSNDTNVVFAHAEIVVASTYHYETGVKIFTDNDVNDLMYNSASVIERLATIGMSLSGIEWAATE